MRSQSVAVALVLAAAPRAAPAYDSLGEVHPCPEGHLPAVCCFEPERDGFVVTLCGLYSRQWDAVEHFDYEEHTVSTEFREQPRPRVQFRSHTGWKWLDARDPSAGCSDAPGSSSGTRWSNGSTMPAGCPPALAAALPVLSQRDFARLRPRAHGDGAGKQEVGTCVEQGGHVWFGLAFYDGEGVTGVGGVGRFDPQTNRIEIRRPRLLRGSSSAALFHDGRWLWLATYRFAEGGDQPTIGIVRYDWERDQIVAERGAMCGFLAKGMKKLGDALWLASDGGLSRRDSRGHWEHFVFRVGDERALEKTTCAQVYDLARTTVEADERDSCSFEEQLRAYSKARARAAAR